MHFPNNYAKRYAFQNPQVIILRHIKRQVILNKFQILSSNDECCRKNTYNLEVTDDRVNKL